MHRVVTLIIIFFATSVVAMLATPTGDPWSVYIVQALVLCTAIPCYFVGLRQGRIAANNAWSQGESPLGTAGHKNTVN